MTDTEFTAPMTMEEIERRARAMRAQVARDIAAAIGRGLRRALGAVIGTGHKTARA